MSEHHTGSALLDELLSRRYAIAERWAAAAVPEHAGPPPLPRWGPKSVEERLEEAEKLRGTVSWDKFRKIEDAILDSAAKFYELKPRPKPKIRELGYLSVGDIQRVVAWYYGVHLVDIIGSRRKSRAVRPRHVAIYLCKVLTPRSFNEIGQQFGGRDHTTLLHAVRKMDGLINGTATECGKKSNRYKARAPDWWLVTQIATLKEMLR